MPADHGHRDRLLAAARTVMLREGYSGTRVDDVCVAAGVTKGSFYHHFRSKSEIARAVLEDFFTTLAAALGAGEWTRIEDARERAVALLGHVGKVVDGPVLGEGCLLGVLTVDRAAADDVVREDASAKFGAIVGLLAPHFEAAWAEAGSSAADAAARGRASATQLVALIEGGLLLRRAFGSDAKASSGILAMRDLLSDSLGRR